MKKTKSKLSRVIGNLDIWASCIVLVALIVLTFVGVLRRYIFRSPIAWMEEVQMIMFLWVVFLVAGAAFRSGSHIAIEILVDALPSKIRIFIERFDVIIQLIIVGYLSWQCFVYYGQMVSTNKVTIFLQMPYSIAYAVLPIGCVLMIIGVIYRGIADIHEKKEEVTEHE